MVIDWATNKIQIAAPHMQNILVTIRYLLLQFRGTLFPHVYRELNTEADKLLKLALAVVPGVLKVHDSRDGIGFDYSLLKTLFWKFLKQI